MRSCHSPQHRSRTWVYRDSETQCKMTGQAQPNISASYVVGCCPESSCFLVKVHSPQQGPKCNKARSRDLVLQECQRQRKRQKVSED